MLRIGTLVKNGRYEIASLPYTNEEDANSDIREYWEGIKCATYPCEKDNKCYIVVPAKSSKEHKGMS